MTGFDGLLPSDDGLVALLVFAGICWTGVAVDALVHVALGDFVVPTAFALAFAAWVTLFRRHYAKVPVGASMVPVEA